MIVKNHGKVLLSFDVEEFDLPREHGGKISVERGVEVSSEGLSKVLDLLEQTNIKATFFVTGNFATINPEMTREILKRGHEIGCHGVDHFEPKQSDIAESKKIIEKIIGGKVGGYRQPRMFKINYHELATCGYLYDSSVNPAFIPGRYNHFKVPRKPFVREGVVEVPTSVASLMRIPLFWLALHLFPVSFYLNLVKVCLRETGYFATYFHPWEFSDLSEWREVPGYIKKNSGDKLVKRLKKVIYELKKRGCEFKTYKEFVENL